MPGEENKKIMVKPKDETERIIIQAMKSVLVTVKDKTVTSLSWEKVNQRHKLFDIMKKM